MARILPKLFDSPAKPSRAVAASAKNPAVAAMEALWASAKKGPDPVLARRLIDLESKTKIVTDKTVSMADLSDPKVKTWLSESGCSQRTSEPASVATSR